MLTPLRRERVLRQMSLYDVRSRTGISVSKLSLVERGIEPPSDDERKRLSKLFGLRIDEVWNPSDRKKNEVQETQTSEV